MTEKKTGSGLSKAGLAVGSIAGSWLAMAPILGHMARPWPCLVLGLAILACIAMAWKVPRQRRLGSILVILFSSSAFLLGSNAIVPGLLGIAGGAFLLEWS